MPFTTVFALSPTFIIEANHGNRDVIVNLYSLSNTGAVIRCWDFDNATNDGQLTYVALGKQQWGKHARTTDYEQITFPISFTNVNYTCISTSYDLNSNADVTSAYSGTYNSGKYPEEQERTVSRFYVKTGSNAGGRDWIAIGQQQWGYYKATSSSYTLTFPIAFSSKTCAVCVTNVNSGSGYPVTYTPNTNSIQINNKCYENFWIAAGFQRSGDLVNLHMLRQQRIHTPWLTLLMCLTWLLVLQVVVRAPAE